MWRLMIRNARRALRRVLMTVVAVGAGLLAFLLLRTLCSGWLDQVHQTPLDRLSIRHRLGWELSLSMQDVDEVRQFPGVQAAVAARFADLQLPARPTLFFGALAVEAEGFVELFDELVAPPDQQRAFVSTRRGAWVSAALADELGWHVGDELRLKDKDTSADVELVVSGIYRSKRKGFANRTLWFHWEYYDDFLPESQRGKVTTITARVQDESRAAAIAMAIDTHFDSRPRPTFSQPDQALYASLVGRFRALWQALDAVSWMVLGVVLLILVNAMTITTRERTREYALLRALGFQPRQVWALIVGEALALVVTGALGAVLLATPVARAAFQGLLREQLGLSGLEVSAHDALTALALSALLGLLASALPMRRFVAVPVVEALRRIH